MEFISAADAGSTKLQHKNCLKQKQYNGQYKVVVVVVVS